MYMHGYTDYLVHQEHLGDLVREAARTQPQIERLPGQVSWLDRILIRLGGRLCSFGADLQRRHGPLAVARGTKRTFAQPARP